MAGYFHRLNALELMSRADLAEWIRDRLVTVPHVWPEDEFATGRLPSAANNPLGDLPLPTCRGARRSSPIAGALIASLPSRR